MNVVTRATRRLGRELKKHARLRQARREGLAFVEPNFVFRPDFAPQAVAIDAGCSYQADFSVLLMDRYHARAFGVDPTRKHRNALARLEDRYPGRFVHVPCAIAAADGRLTFHESEANESGSLFDDHVNVLRDRITSYDVEAVTLGTLLRRLGVETVDILKLDLEGAEYALLENMTRETLRPFRQVFVEFHHHAVSHFGPADTRRIVDLVSGLGFRSFSVDDHNYLFYRDR